MEVCNASDQGVIRQVTSLPDDAEGDIKMRRIIIPVILIVTLLATTGFYWKQHTKQGVTRDHYPYIRNITEGETISGGRLLEVVYLESGGAPIINLFLDGEQINMSTPTQQLEPEKYVMISLDTRHYANGPHTLRVVDNKGGVDTRKVTFHNTIVVTYWISGFSLHPAPKSQGASDIGVVYDTKTGEKLDMDAPPPTQASFEASLASRKQWTATICTPNPRHAVLRTFNGNGDKIEVTWNGKDAKGRVVPDGNYALIVHIAGWKDLEYNINKF